MNLTARNTQTKDLHQISPTSAQIELNIRTFGEFGKESIKTKNSETIILKFNEFFGVADVLRLNV